MQSKVEHGRLFVACPEGTYHVESGPGDISSCQPCPDVQHTSPLASTSSDQCTCKPGYVTSGKKCKVIECPPLSPPDHGYFVNGICSSVIHAACGIRCDSGYKLVGSSVRLCTVDGTWSGTNVRCEMKTCSPLSVPRHGSVVCTTDSYVFETKCHFRCDPGYKLVGSKVRTCLAIALWDGLPALCRPVDCPPLSTIDNGHVSPAKCTESNVKYGDVCTYNCKQGFVVRGPAIRR
ncbi:sushi, von Willebrand factor type A, EGF and pentraxin domain-containing protein 1-like [Tachypleus tridentatus]|uniref:sushi, von Willebrand factor type A, EGF and pentraxin domain-containing protein 1-like n=1 Tax=Tachypleus tridentatus TaxID=6853 RepID=UPI003FD67418